MVNKISVVILTKNSSKYLKQVLNAVSSFDEVVIFDNGSTDNTKEICKNFKNVNLVVGQFSGFGPTKNEAAGFAKNDWVLSLDSDEVLTQEFVEALKKKVLDSSCIYTILRKNFYKQTEIKYCWSNDIIVRLYDRTKTMFNNNMVHESIIDDGFIKNELNGVVKHYPYANISDFIVKIDRYSSLFANENRGIKRSTPLKAFINATYSFIKTYILKRGFLDGYAGLIISVTHATSNFYKYMKLYELNKNKEK